MIDKKKIAALEGINVADLEEIEETTTVPVAPPPPKEKPKAKKAFVSDAEAAQLANDALGQRIGIAGRGSPLYNDPDRRAAQLAQYPHLRPRRIGL